MMVATKKKRPLRPIVEAIMRVGEVLSSATAIVKTVLVTQIVSTKGTHFLDKGIQHK